jgi:hypothetical protein
MGANNVSSLTVLVLSVFQFVQSLRMDGTGYADTLAEGTGKPHEQDARLSAMSS